MPASYIPATDAAFDAWMANFSTLLTADPTAYGEDAASALVVQTAYDTWSPAYLLATDPITRTSPTIADKDAERANLDAAARPVAQRINARSSVTNIQRSALGITIRKTTRTPVPAPGTAPSIVLRSLTPGVAQLQIRDSTTPTTKAKPAGVIGCELHVEVAAVAGTDPANATFIKTSTKTPNTLSFTAGQAGQVATVWGRWATRSGPSGVAQVGPWSAAESFVIA